MLNVIRPPGGIRAPGGIRGFVFVVLQKTGVLDVAAVEGLQGLRVGADEEGSGAPDDDEGDDPAEGRLEEEALVDPGGAFEEADGDGGPDLAMSRREGPPLGRAVDDDESGPEFDAVPAGGCNCRELDTHGRHDLVAVGRETCAKINGVPGKLIN